jgi:hypothetical protein
VSRRRRPLRERERELDFGPRLHGGSWLQLCMVICMWGKKFVQPGARQPRATPSESQARRDPTDAEGVQNVTSISFTFKLLSLTF